MDIRLYPRPVPAITAHQTAGDRLQIWIGVFGVAAPPPIQWFLNGTPITPTTIADLHSVRSAELVPVDFTASLRGRVRIHRPTA